MAFRLLLVVLAITFNQGASRPADNDLGFITKNEVNSSEEGSQQNSDQGIVFKIPTDITRGLMITINGTINMNDKKFTVVLPSLSGKDSCTITYDFEKKTLSTTPAVIDFDTQEYDPNLSSGSEPQTFSLSLKARVDRREQEFFGMNFIINNDSGSTQLLCNIESFADINSIVLKDGVAHVDTLMFEFEEDY